MSKTSCRHLAWRFALTTLVIGAAWIIATDKSKRATMKSRHLGDIKISSELTREQVMALWGPPDGIRPSATGIEFSAYTLDDGQELWFVWNLESPSFGEGAVLISTTGEYKRLFRKSRRLDDIKLSGKLSHDQV